MLQSREERIEPRRVLSDQVSSVCGTAVPKNKSAVSHPIAVHANHCAGRVGQHRRNPLLSEPPPARGLTGGTNPGAAPHTCRCNDWLVQGGLEGAEENFPVVVSAPSLQVSYSKARGVLTTKL